MWIQRCGAIAHPKVLFVYCSKCAHSTEKCCGVSYYFNIIFWEIKNCNYYCYKFEPIYEFKPVSGECELQTKAIQGTNQFCENGVDIRSCVQFVLDLFSQWVLPNVSILSYKLKNNYFIY